MLRAELRRRFGPLLIALFALTAQIYPISSARAAPEMPDATTFAIRVEQGDMRSVGEWLDSGLDPNFEGDRVGTGLMIAAWQGNIPMMELFVTHGADVNRTNDVGEQALMHATWKGRREAVVWLLDHGAQINRRQNEWSALHYAAFAGHAELAGFLVQKGADVNARSTNGSTVLMMAAREGRENIARMLMDAGAVRSAANDWGEDALAWAMRAGNLTIARMVSAAEEFAAVAAKPPDSAPIAMQTVAAPPEVEKIIADRRLAHVNGTPMVLSDEDYKKILARIAKMKPAVAPSKPPGRLSITAKKGEPRREKAELLYGEASTADPARRAVPVNARKLPADAAGVSRQ